MRDALRELAEDPDDREAAGRALEALEDAPRGSYDWSSIASQAGRDDPDVTSALREVGSRILERSRGAGYPALDPGTGESESVRVRVTSEHMAELDRLIAEGRAPNRSAAVRWLIAASARQVDQCSNEPAPPV